VGRGGRETEWMGLCCGCRKEILDAGYLYSDSTTQTHSSSLKIKVSVKTLVLKVHTEAGKRLLVATVKSSVCIACENVNSNRISQNTMRTVL
jgi:hypothetical protein